MAILSKRFAPSSMSLAMCGIAGVLAVSGTLLFVRWVKFAASLSQNIPTHDPVGDYLGGVFMAAILSLIIWLSKPATKERRILLLLWLVKSVVILFPMLFYEANYET